MNFAIKTVAASILLASAGGVFAQKGETVKIAWLDPLSGLMAAVGTNQLKTWQFVAEEFNKKNAAGVKYEIIGIVSASSDAGWTEQGSVDYAVQELKNQAAKLGANGVFIESTGEQTSTIIGGQGTNYLYAIPVTAKTVSGKAIFVIE